MSRTLLLAAFVLAALPALADEPVDGTMRIDTTVEIKPTGDSVSRIVFDYSPNDYVAKKQTTPNPMDFMRNMASQRTDFEVSSDMSCRYEDASSTMVMDFTEVGAVRYLGNGRWEVNVGTGPEFITQKEEDGRTVAYFYESSLGAAGNMPSKGQVHYLLPPGAKDVKYVPADGKLAFTLEVVDNGKAGRVTAELKVKTRLMTGIYKVYGLGTDFSAMWVAKALLKNTGEGKVKNLRVRYRLQGYSEWCTWHKIAEVVPGQTVVDVWYPALDQKIAQLRTNTPADAEMEWKYDDGTGKEQEDNEGKRIVLLGVNEFVFRNLVAGESAGNWGETMGNAPFLAAWVSRDDPIMKTLGAWANKNAAGVGALENDENAIAVLRECYNLMLANDFTYQHPPTLQDRNVSFDPELVQNVKFPRDVVRDKSGTCIDLAICYAAMAHSIGLRPHLALIPGHCFPVIDLPSGSCLAVETTGVQGGIRFGSADFDKVTAFGKQELEESRADGRIVMVDVQDYWTRGVSNPELENLPADILQRWEIVPKGDATPKPQPPANGGDQTVSIDGKWAARIQQEVEDGRVVDMNIEFTLQSRPEGGYDATMVLQTEVIGPNGPAAVQIDETFTGEVRENKLVLQGQKCTRTIVAWGEKKEMSIDDASFELLNGQLVGKVGNAEEGYTELKMDRQ